MTLGSGGGHSDKKDYLKANSDTLLFRYLDTNGNGTGTKAALGDYESAAEEFYIQPPVDTLYVIHRMIVHIEDGTQFAAGKYGAMDALTNGVSIKIKQLSPAIDLIDMCDGITIKTNAGWGAVCFDAEDSDYGTGATFLNVRWTYAKSGQPLVINENQKFVVGLNDDMSDLIAHTFMVQGYIVPNKVKVT
jgi:hypothetical protein